MYNRVGKQRFRTLIDTGAEVSLINSKIFKNLQERPRLRKEKVKLTSRKW